MKKSSLILLAFALTLHLDASDYRTKEYQNLQERLCTGWNTWYNDNMIAHVCLPESFAINLGVFKRHFGWLQPNYLDNVLKASGFSGRREAVVPGMRSDDGSYTSLSLSFEGIEVKVESAVDGRDQLILVTPLQPYDDDCLVVEAGIIFGAEGMVGREGTSIKAICGRREFVVRSTSESVPCEYLPSISPRLAYSLETPVGIYTGRQRTLGEIQSKVSTARKKVETRMAGYGDMADSFLAMQTILSWNTIYDSGNRRVITPVSRNWNRLWGGYVLFDWDTYFASYMLSLFNKDLAMANAIEMTKSISPEGFIPNCISVGRRAGATHSQPPIGSEIIWRIYQQYPERWFLEETYDELLEWNRWWVRNRMIEGYLAWGCKDMEDDGDVLGGLQEAKFESGLDNSPMYDKVPMNASTHTMELADVGLNSMYVMDCKALAEIAAVLGKKDDVMELKDRAERFTAKLATLWDEESGIFLNLRTDTHEFSHSISPTNLYPMLAGACTHEQAERMMKDHYFNPEEFYGEYVLPSIARNHPAFENNYWRGRIWGPMNFLVYMGMQKYEVKEAREDLVNRSGALFMKNWKDGGFVYENYNSQTGEGDDVHNADGYYHWGALLTFMEFLERARKNP